MESGQFGGWDWVTRNGQYRMCLAVSKSLGSQNKAWNNDFFFD
jgi:hypothetical protein